MMTSSPASTNSTNLESVVLASCMFTT
jgi:hypothetical protein